MPDKSRCAADGDRGAGGPSLLAALGRERSIGEMGALCQASTERVERRHLTGHVSWHGVAQGGRQGGESRRPPSFAGRLPFFWCGIGDRPGARGDRIVG